MANPNDAWDWPYILYVGKVWLHYTEDEVWRLTPRKFKALLKVHLDLLKQKVQAQAGNAPSQGTMGYIDTIPGW